MLPRLSFDELNLNRHRTKQLIRCHGPRTEGPAWYPIGHEPKINVAVREIHKVLGVEGRLQFLREGGGVLCSDPEGIRLAALGGRPA